MEVSGETNQNDDPMKDNTLEDFLNKDKKSDLDFSELKTDGELRMSLPTSSTSTSPLIRPSCLLGKSLS